jgi:hypothetical protein
VYTGVVTVMALPRARQCPRPARVLPYGDAITVTERRFSAELAIRDACLAGRKLRLCGYLTAQRRTTSVLRTVTVARDSTTVTVAVPGNSSGKRRRRADPRRDHGLDLRHLAHRRACASEAGCSTTPRPLPRATTGGVHVGRATCPTRRAPLHRRHRPRAPDDHHQRRAPRRPSRPQPQPQAELPRRRAKPRDVIQDAVDAITDTYRDRLQNILEQRDGPDWLDARNHRRQVSMTLAGKRAPRPYEFLEPRAVLNCLAYDPAGQQLISAPATTKARQLSGLVNEAHHLSPHAPPPATRSTAETDHSGPDASGRGEHGRSVARPVRRV